ncbi:MAG: SCO family protein [Leptospiraceae bacterium]|nr:SCO family protein [Leptospiraceae bacterium]MCP5500025.1 SCO family protein [Leptospiraceae bacterium]
MKKIILFLILSNLIAVAGIFYYNSKSNLPSPQKLRLSTLPVGGDFGIHNGNMNFDLKTYRGKLVLLYFGYTFCPDICPTTLSIFSKALQKLKPEELQQIQTVFISVDPKRDTEEKLQKYVSFFHKSLIALTDKPEKIADIAKQYGVSYQKHFVKEGEPFYTIDHSTQSFLIGKDGKIAKFIPHGILPEKLAEEIRSNF